MSERLTDTELLAIEQHAQTHLATAPFSAGAGAIVRLIEELRELRRERDALRARLISLGATSGVGL